MSMTPQSNYKKKRRLVHRNVSLTLICADIVSMALALIFAKKALLLIKNIYALDGYSGPIYSYIYLHDLLFILLCPFVLFYFLSKGHYTQRVPWWSQVQNILKACLLAFIFDGFIRFALGMDVSRLMISLSWIFLFFLCLSGRQISFLFLKKQNIWNIDTICIGDIDTISNLLFAFQTDQYPGFDVKTVLLRDNKDNILDLDILPKRYKNIEVIRDNIDYDKFIRDNHTKFFIVCLETFRGQDRDNIINTLVKTKALYAIVPPTSRVNTYEMEPRHFFGYDIMLLHAKSPMLSPIERVLKRSMDVLVSGIALLLLLPIIIVVAIFLKIEGQGGSIFYSGKRIGRYGHHFKCWKFRSMEPNSDHLLHQLLENDPQAKYDWEHYRKLKQDDPRVTTKTAKIIRKASIDELPQLWNVFIGDMSLVGPRPILEEEIALFGDSINEYMRVRPGITGLWQVSGRNDTTFQRRVYWDSWYVRNWSLWGDIVILFKTLGVVIFGKGAF